MGIRRQTMVMAMFLDLILALVLCGTVFSQERQEPAKCCLPDKSSMVMYDVATLNNLKISTLEIQIDMVNKKQAVIQIDVNPYVNDTHQEPGNNGRSIIDFEKRIVYTLPTADPTKCYKFPYTFPLIKCIPDNATYLGSSWLGSLTGASLEGQVPYDGWRFTTADGSTVTIAVSKQGCVPLVEGVARPPAAGGSSTYFFQNYTATLQDP